MGEMSGLAGGDKTRARATKSGNIDMRVAAGIFVAVALCAPTLAWSQTAAPQAAPPAPVDRQKGRGKQDNKDKGKEN